VAGLELFQKWYNKIMKIVIQKTKKEDINRLAQIYKRAYDRSGFGENWNVQKATSLLRFYQEQKNFVGVTAVADNKIVGAFFSYVKPWHDGNHLGEGELFVDPAYQNKKIGTKLFMEMMKIAKKKRCVIHELVAYDRIARWYKKIGLKNSGLKHMTGNIGEILKKVVI